MQKRISIISKRFLFITAGLASIGCAQEHGGDYDAHEQLHAPSEAASVHSDHSAAEHSEEAHKSETEAVTTRSADSHIHGGAVLSIAAENNALVMELETPLYNLLGFEYDPKTPEEKARVSEVEAQLLNPETLILFNPEAGCSYEKPVRRVSLFEDHSDDDHDDDDHDDDGHDDDGHDDEGHDDEGHTDVILEYGLRCKSIAKLKKIDAPLFKAFPFFKELELVYLGPSQQMSADLSSSRPTADLTR